VTTDEACESPSYNLVRSSLISGARAFNDIKTHLPSVLITHPMLGLSLALAKRLDCKVRVQGADIYLSASPPYSGWL
jgi:hypothetical protein